MPQYFRLPSGQYITAGEQGEIQTVTEQDIIGRRGTVPSGTDVLGLVRKEGDIRDITPGQLRFEAETEPGESGFNIFDPTGNVGRVTNLAQAQALGLSLPGTLPQGQMGANQEFANYLQSTGQTFAGGQFRPGQDLATIQPQFDATIGRGGQAPLQVGGQFGQRTFGRAGEQVFETTGGQRRPITSKEFEEQLKSQGLNLEVLPPLGPAPTPGQQEVEKTLGAGATGTFKFPSEQTDFLKTIQDRFAKTDEMIASILTAGERSEEEKKLKQTIGDITTSFEAGLQDINGQTIPMSLIIGQGAELEKRATDKVKALTRLLDIYKDDREAKYNTLVKAYDLSRNSTNDMIALYKLTQPDKIAFNSTTGEVIFSNPMTGEITTKKAPGYTPTPDKTPLQKEYEYMVTQGYKGSVMDYATLKATQYGTEDPTKDIFKQTQDSLQQYKDQGYTRKEVEQEWRTQNAASGQDPKDVILPLTVKRALDALYPETKTSEPTQPTGETKWYNPLSWF